MTFFSFSLILNFIYFFIQQVLISHQFYTHQCIHVNRNRPIHPSLPSLSPCPQVHSLHLRLHSCPVPRFIRTIFFFRFHIYVLAHGICFSLYDLLHAVWQPLGPSTSLQITQLPFYGRVIFHCIYVPHLLDPFICQWTLKLLPHPGYCK